MAVTFGRARRQVIRSSGYWDDPTGRPVALRLSGFFADAPAEVVDALAAWLRGRRRGGAAGALLDAWIAANLAADPAPPRKRPPADTRGAAHDLAALTDVVLAPGGPLDPAELAPLGRPLVTWGKRGRSRARRSLQLGSYEEDRHLVRIHRVLDQPDVPAWFVGFVVYHELLHAAQAAAARRADETRARAAADGELAPAPRGRRTVHDAAFRAREAAHPDHARAEAWQRRHIGALLRSARTGRPLATGPVARARAAVAETLEQLRLDF